MSCCASFEVQLLRVPVGSWVTSGTQAILGWNLDSPFFLFTQASAALVASAGRARRLACAWAQAEDWRRRLAAAAEALEASLAAEAELSKEIEATDIVAAGATEATEAAATRAAVGESANAGQVAAVAMAAAVGPFDGELHDVSFGAADDDDGGGGGDGGGAAAAGTGGAGGFGN